MRTEVEIKGEYAQKEKDEIKWENKGRLIEIYCAGKEDSGRRQAAVFNQRWPHVRFYPMVSHIWGMMSENLFHILWDDSTSMHNAHAPALIIPTSMSSHKISIKILSHCFPVPVN